MFRAFALGLLLTIPAAVQSQCPTNCQNVELAPISGRVLNAYDNSPLAGAVVHYRGVGGTTDNEKRELNPTTLEGQVTTASDGSYTLPQLPPGVYIVRAYAPGFLGVRKFLQPLPVHFNPGPPIPISPKICMATVGKPACGYLPGPPNGVFQLAPNLLHLQPMSNEALAAFALPLRDTPSRQFLAGAFTPDGDRLGVLTSDRINIGDTREGPPQAPFERCAVWTYDLSSGILTPAQNDLLESFCQNPATLVWDREFLYIDLQKQPGTASADFTAERVEGGSALPWLAANLPRTVQAQLARQAANAAADQAAFKKTQNVSQVTDDRQFIVEDHLAYNRSNCETLEVLAAQASQPKKLTTQCYGLTYMLDPVRDLLFYTEQPTEWSGQPAAFGRLVEYNLKTEGLRSFDLPMGAQGHGPQLLAQQPLPRGGTRLAYAVHGDCDPASSDYAETFTPGNELDPTPNQFSVCFVTVPPGH